MEIDLDALRAVRAEAKKKTAEKHTVKFKGKVFPLPDEPPFALELGRFTKDSKLLLEGTKQLLGERWQEFLELEPTLDDVAQLAGSALSALGSLGEAPASNGSSRNTSRRSRPTSNGSTGSTSGKRSGGRTG